MTDEKKPELEVPKRSVALDRLIKEVEVEKATRGVSTGRYNRIYHRHNR